MSATGGAVVWQCQSATLVRQGRTVLQDLSIRIEAGERLAIVGPNGSGKSSLLRLMHGLLRPTSGEVRHTHGLTQSLMFQHPHWLRSSVRLNVSLGLWLDREQGLGWQACQQRALQALGLVGLAHLAERPARQLSGGEQQRVALARALARHPHVLLLDEPTASLDPQARREFESLLQPGSETPTLIWVTHQLAQAKRMATRVICLQAGRVLADVPAQTFFDPERLAQVSPAALSFVEGELA